jgi:hypothetical protein
MRIHDTLCCQDQLLPFLVTNAMLTAVRFAQIAHFSQKHLKFIADNLDRHTDKEERQNFCDYILSAA